MTDVFSPKQKSALGLVKSGGLRRINLLEGSVRSGKTWISMIMWGFWVASAPENGAYLMAGKTLTTMRRNVLEPMCGLFGSCFTYSLSKKEGRLFGRKIYLEGASNAQAESKIRGMTLNGAYCDELSLFPEDFFAMLLSRLSVSGAKLIATTNPDNPGHWLKRNYLDNDALDLLDLKFTLDDNPFLPSEYVRALKTEYTGVFYDRFILGNWTAAEGRIYEDFSQKCVISPQELRQRLSESPLTTSVIGVDYGGNKSASAFVHTGFDAGFSNVYVLAEHYDKRNVSAESLISAFADFVTQERERFPTLEMACCDSAEQLLIKSFRSAVSLEVRNAMKKPVSTRINMVNRLISAGRLHISSECPHLIEALKTAVWDEKSLHKDVRLDDGSTNIDSLDAFEYSLERFEWELFRY